MRVVQRVVLLLLGAICFMPCAAGQRTVAEQYLFTALNASRAAAGLSPIKWSENLSAAAARHAESMRRADMVSHELDHEADLPARTAASGLRFFVVAENVGVARNAAQLHDEWFQSADHRENMLAPSVNAVGIAVLGGGDEVWGVEDFAGTIEKLSLAQQEARVGTLLRAAGVRATATAAARAMCLRSTGYARSKPTFVMRFNSTDLSGLPQELLAYLQQGGVSQAAVGACDYPQQTFSSYSVAVALYR